VAFPVILIDSATGSDTAASGAGPAAAVTGTSAAHTAGVASTTITLTNSPNLSGVATDGSAAIFLNIATAGTRNFSRITAVDNVGKKVTVEDSFTIATASAVTYAIGGRRVSLGSATSSKLWNNNGAAGDAKGGWVIEMQSGHAETFAARVNWYSAGDFTNGCIILRGILGAAVRPTLTFNAADWVTRGKYNWFVNFNVVGTAGATLFIQDVGLNNRYEGLKISGFSGTLIDGSAAGGLYLSQIVGCELVGGSVGIRCTQDLHIIGNYIHGQTSHGITSPNSSLTGLTIYGNEIAGCGGDGINLTQSRADQFGGVLVSQNTVTGCTGNGFTYVGDFDSMSALTLLNNIFSNNGAYGINFSALTAGKVLSRSGIVKNNNCYLNTSGACNLSGVLENNLGLDPQYTNAAAGDVSIGTNLKAQGYPSRVGGPTGATPTYIDLGAAQRQEPAGGGGGGTGAGTGAVILL
jgi:hypothetical protein